MNSVFLDIKGNEFLTNHGHYGKGFKVELSEKYSLSEYNYDSINEYWEKAFKNLPYNSIFVKSDFFVEDEFKASFLKKGNYLETATYNEFHNKKYLNHTCLVFFIKPTFDTFLNSKWSNPFKKPVKKSFEKYTRDKNDYFEKIDFQIDFLQSKKGDFANFFSFTPLNEKEFEDYEDIYFSGLIKGITTNVIEDTKNVLVGDQKVGVVSLINEKKFPKALFSCIENSTYSTTKYKFFQNIGENFDFNLNFSHVYNQILFIDDPKRRLKKIESNYIDLVRSRGFSRVNKKNAEELEPVIEDLHSSTQERFFIRGHINVLFFDETEDGLKSKQKEVLQAFQDFTPHVTPVKQKIKSLYYNSFAGNTPFFNNQQLFILPIEGFTPFILNTSHYKNDKEGVLYNSRIDNLPTLVDNFFEDKKYGNARNSIRIASTGYGKSVDTNHEIETNTRKGEKSVIIDYGGSYKKLQALYPDITQYITYQEGKTLGYNPFNTLNDGNGNYEKLSSQMNFNLTEFIVVHYKEVKATQSEKDSLSKLLTYYYSINTGYKSLPNFIKFVGDNKDLIENDLKIKEEYFNIDSFLHLTEKFLPNGILGFLYDTSLDSYIDKEDALITVFEFEAIKDNPLLLRIMLLLANIIIDQYIIKDTETRGHLYFDEIAKMFKYDGIMEQVELFFQTLRKKKSGIHIILQTIHQLPKNNTFSDSIIENCPVLHVLYAKDYKPIQERFNLSDHAYYSMCSLTSNTKGKEPYSEKFILRGNHFQIYRLKLPKEALLTYETDGTDNENLMKHFRKSGDIKKSIEYIINQKNQ